MSEIAFSYTIVAVMASAMMTLAWLAHLKYKNASLGDIPWCFGNIVFFAALTQYHHNWSTAHIVYLLIITLWSARLGIYLTGRIFKDPYKEDDRFKKIRSDVKKNEGLIFFGLFQFQAFLQILLSSCYVVCAMDSGLHIGLAQIFALFLFIISFILQWIADFQLADFSRHNHNQKSVCDKGLWKYSRHPNYFFEWCIWLSLAIFALNSPLALLAFLSPLVIYVVLTQISGVKLSEEVSLAKRGEAYKEYMSRTSSFFPLPAKTAKSEKR